MKQKDDKIKEAVMKKAVAIVTGKAIPVYGWVIETTDLSAYQDGDSIVFETESEDVYFTISSSYPAKSIEFKLAKTVLDNEPRIKTGKKVNCCSCKKVQWIDLSRNDCYCKNCQRYIQKA